MAVVHADLVDDIQKVLRVHGQPMSGGKHTPIDRGCVILIQNISISGRLCLLSVARLHGSVVVLFNQLHGVHELAHVRGQNFVRHLDLELEKSIR